MAAASSPRQLGRRAAGLTPGSFAWLLVIPALLLLWQALALVVGTYALSSPAETWAAIVEGVTRGTLGANLSVTVLQVVLGYAIAAATGLALGFGLGLRPFAATVLEPLLLTLYAIPKVTLFPVFLFLFGLGINSKIAFGAFHGVFPVVLFTMQATRSTPRILLKVARVSRLSGWATFRHVVFPWAAPSILTGLRFGFAVSYLGVVLGEMFASRQGSGYELVQAAVAHDLPRTFAIVTLLVVVAFVVNGLFLLGEWRLTHASRRPVVQV